MIREKVLKVAKPILFNTDMVRAIQNGTKTVTRRLIKDIPTAAMCTLCTSWCRDFATFTWYIKAQNADIYFEQEEDFCFPYKIGDILYVRETFCTFDSDHIIDGVKYAYKANSTSESERTRKDFGYKWKPSTHMPKEAARIFLRVTNVRVGRLQKSFFKSGSTIFALLGEGVNIGEQCRECIGVYGSPCCIDDESECGTLDEVRSDFSDLWNSTVKKSELAKYGWAANPWVFIIEFERIEVE